MAKDKEEQPKVSSWDAWRSRLSGHTRAALDGKPKETDPATPYSEWLATLSEEARSLLSGVVEGDDEPLSNEPDFGTFRYAMVECTSGEYPLMRLFKTPEAITKHLGKLDGEDVAVWCFYGIPMRFTVGPQRYLHLPDGITSVSVPMYKGGPCKRTTTDLITADIQDDGFLGPPELLQPPSIEEEDDDSGGAEDGETVVN